ncbi:MAG: preprotein translocase subunit SecE [Rhodobacteraceae bacterium]|nr:preprotein translocase subunit SecE [Paracoccaceae bacterium]
MATRTNPFQFIQQVRSEVSKVVWPGRREVLVTTGMVFVLCTITAVFFFVVDFGIREALKLVLGYFG